MKTLLLNLLITMTTLSASAQSLEKEFSDMPKKKEQYLKQLEPQIVSEKNKNLDNFAPQMAADMQREIGATAVELKKRISEYSEFKGSAPEDLYEVYFKIPGGTVCTVLILSNTIPISSAKYYGGVPAHYKVAFLAISAANFRCRSMGREEKREMRAFSMVGPESATLQRYFELKGQ